MYDIKIYMFIISYFIFIMIDAAVVFLKNTTALKMAGKKYHGEGKIGESHNICGKIA
jgi:hypothetical protein